MSQHSVFISCASENADAAQRNISVMLPKSVPDLDLSSVWERAIGAGFGVCEINHMVDLVHEFRGSALIRVSKLHESDAGCSITLGHAYVCKQSARAGLESVAETRLQGLPRATSISTSEW